MPQLSLAGKKLTWPWLLAACSRCHGVMKELGFSKFLFFALCAMDFLRPTQKMMRLHEFKVFLLMEPNLNTVDQQGSYKEYRWLD